MPDVNLISYDAAFNGKKINLQKSGTIDGRGYDDAIHLSRVNDLILYLDKVISGDEDAIDINNESTSISIYANKLSLIGRTGITIKGGSSHIYISAEIDGDGIIELGGWSDQSQKRTTYVRLYIRRPDGKAQRVRVLDADKPSISGCEVEYMFPSPNMGKPLHTLCVYGFKTLRRWGFWRD